MKRLIMTIWNFFFWQLPPLDEEAQRWTEGLPRLEGAGEPPRSLTGAAADPPKK